MGGLFAAMLFAQAVAGKLADGSSLSEDRQCLAYSALIIRQLVEDKQFDTIPAMKIELAYFYGRVEAVTGKALIEELNPNLVNDVNRRVREVDILCLPRMKKVVEDQSLLIKAMRIVDSKAKPESPAK